MPARLLLLLLLLLWLLMVVVVVLLLCDIIPSPSSPYPPSSQVELRRPCPHLGLQQSELLHQRWCSGGG